MKKALLVLLVVLVCASVAFAGGNKEKAAEGNKVLRMLTWTGYAPQSQIDEFFRTLFQLPEVVNILQWIKEQTDEQPETR